MCYLLCWCVYVIEAQHNIANLILKKECKNTDATDHLEPDDIGDNKSGTKNYLAYISCICSHICMSTP